MYHGYLILQLANNLFGTYKLYQYCMVNQGIRIFAKIFLGKSTIYILNPIYLFYHAIYQNRHTKNDN